METYNPGDVEISQKSSKSLISTAFPLFHRSLTAHPMSKPVLPTFERNGSIKPSSKSKPVLSTFERNGSIKPSSTSVSGPMTSFRGKVKKFYSIFDKKSSKHPKTTSHETLGLSRLCVTESASAPRLSSSPFEWIYLPGTEDRVVIYFTSLRGIRRTFIDCSYVLMILRAFRIELDERDISMHSAYRKELTNVLREKSATLSLPQVFIKGKHIGGADLIRQLHETGELAKMLRGIPIRTSMKACDECGDIRFVPCVNCSGSKKLFDEEEDKVIRCPDCNENGLIHCEICYMDW